MALPPCTAHIKIQRQHVHLTVQMATGELILRAQLPLWPMHPRALLELLEAVARYSGHPLDAVLSATANSAQLFDEAVWHDDLVWGPSPLVNVTLCGPVGTRRLRLPAISRKDWRGR